jgi:hypothetical protein
MEIQLLSKLKTALELVKDYDLDYLKSLKMNKSSKNDDGIRSLRELAKLLDIKVEKGTKKDDLATQIFETLQAIKNESEEKKGNAGQVLKTLDITQAISRRGIKQVADDILPKIVSVLTSVSGSDVYQIIRNQDDALLALAIELSNQEKTVYEFSTINSRRTDLIDRLLVMAEQYQGLYAEALPGLIKRFQKLYNMQFTEDTKIYKASGNFKGQNNAYNSSDIHVSDIYNKAVETINKIKNGSAVYQDWMEVSKAIALCTGRRMVEVHATASFEVVGEYELVFSGQAKQHRKYKADDEQNEFSRDNYVIPTLLLASDMKLALDWLATTKSKKGNNYRLPKETAELNRNAVNAMYSKELNSSITKLYLDSANNNVETKLTYHGLRDVYATICKNLFKMSDDGIFLSKILGHDRRDTQTANTYKKFNVVDWQVVKQHTSIDTAAMIKRNKWDEVG